MLIIKHYRFTTKLAFQFSQTILQLPLLSMPLVHNAVDQLSHKYLLHTYVVLLIFMADLLLRALYEYSAIAEEEISFPEGAIIRLLRKDDNGIDDGWWEGEYMGKRGVFPSIVVEELGGGNGNEVFA